MGRKPDFLIVGPPKTGTTSLYDVLKVHREIGLVQKKEIHFFENNENYARGLDWYYTHFDGLESKKVVGEATPSYFASGLAKARVFKHLPEVRIICILREPIQRLISQYLHFRSTYLALRHNSREELGILGKFEGEDLKLPELIETIRTQPNGDRFDYVRGGEYYVHLREWQELFGREQVYVMFFEELIVDPAVEIGKLLRWLDASQSLPSLKQLNSGQRWHKLSPEIDVTLTPAHRTWLQEHFKPYNEMLFNYLERDPAIWEATA